MEIKITYAQRTFTAECADGPSIDDVLEPIKGLLVAAGFHPDTVDSKIISDYNWYPREDEILDGDTISDTPVNVSTQMLSDSLQELDSKKKCKKKKKCGTTD